MNIILLLVGLVVGFLAGASLHRLAYNSELLKEGYLVIQHPEKKSGNGRLVVKKISMNKAERDLLK